MVVGLATMTLVVADSGSLKDKRRVVRSVTARVRSRFNVAVAEVDDLDRWDSAVLGIVCVSNDAGHAHAMLEKVALFVENERLDAVLAHYAIEML